MNDPECIHGLTEATCATCATPPARRGPPPVPPGAIRARYPGRCRACPDPIDAEDPIVAVRDGMEVVYVHAACADDFTLRATPLYPY